MNQRNDAIHFHGPVRDYLDFPPGEPTRDVTLMALDGLRTRMRAVLRQAFETCELQTATAQRVRRSGKEVVVRITADPVRLQGDEMGGPALSGGCRRAAPGRTRRRCSGRRIGDRAAAGIRPAGHPR